MTCPLKRLATSLLVALASCAHAPTVPAQELSSPKAELILTGGRITTQSDAGEVEAIALGGGKVMAVGSADAMAAWRGPETQVLDLEGRRVIPGLNDSHLHAVRGGRFYNLELRWDGVPSLEVGLRMIREQAARTPDGQWVRVIGGWSPFQFEERRMPTIAELNEAAPDTPVFVLFLYSKGFLNKAGVEALGITPETPAPPGTRYRFVDGGCELLGEPKPSLLYGTIGKLPGLTAEQQVNSTKHWYRELNRFGLTSCADPGGGGHEYPQDYFATDDLAQAGGMTMRVSYYLFPQKPGQEEQDIQGWINQYEPGLDRAQQLLNGYLLQGAGENLIWAAGDFENFLAPRPGLAKAMDRRLEGVVKLLLRHNWPVRIHATYGETVERFLDIFERVDRDVRLAGRRWALDHVETISQQQIDRIRSLGGAVAIQDRMAFAGEYFIERYGAEKAAHAPPLRALLESGVPLGAGTDGTRVSSYNPWVSLYWMVTGKTVGGTQLYGNDNILGRDEALRLYTVGSAWFSGEDGVKGTLGPGSYGDLAVLDTDYFTCPPEDIRGIESVLTVVGGRIVHGAGEYRELAPALPPVIPSWSPVAHYGGYYANQTTQESKMSNPTTTPRKQTGMIKIRPANERGHADHGWLDTWHTFSFASYHDPEHVHWSQLRVINQDKVTPGAGFPTHGHQDMEIISYVLDGILAHKDSMGNGAQMQAGDVQLMSAGTGVTHSEFNASEADGLEFLQMWVIPAQKGTEPRYEQKNYPVTERLNTARLVISPDGRDGSVTIGQDVLMYAGLLEDGKQHAVQIPAGRKAWLHVARGKLSLNGHDLGPGDGAGIDGVTELKLVGCGPERAEFVLFDLP